MPQAPSVTLAESALRDLEGIREYYREQHVPDVGQRLLNDILSAIETLPAHPDKGRVVPEFNQPHLPELIHPPFRIVYRREMERIRVVRIWRSERLLRLP